MRKKNNVARTQQAYTLNIKPIETLLRKCVVSTSQFQLVRENIQPLLIEDKGAFTRKKYYLGKKLMGKK